MSVVVTIFRYIKQFISHFNQLPDGLITQLVEHYTGIAEIMSANPVQAKL